VIITTTHEIEGKKITQYLGLVSGTSILGTSFLRDFFAKVADFSGGRVSTYESELKKARLAAIGEMKAEATRLGANAVVGVRIDFEALGEKGSILMVCASGTAVIVN